MQPNQLLIKICGMRDPGNIAQIARLKPDYMGFIFYPPSPRYVGADNRKLEDLDLHGIKKVGVFVNETPEAIMQAVKRYRLQAVQLHGSESPEICTTLKNQNVEVFKAFPVSQASDFEVTQSYENCCDYFLFDTKTPTHGGSGAKFDWSLLQSYTRRLPFFLSGGIAPDDAAIIATLSHPQLAGVDLNSRFESAPGLKQAGQLAIFIQQLNNQLL